MPSKLNAFVSFVSIRDAFYVIKFMSILHRVGECHSFHTIHVNGRIYSETQISYLFETFWNKAQSLQPPGNGLVPHENIIMKSAKVNLNRGTYIILKPVARFSF